MSEIVAIVGSRDWPDEDRVASYVRALPKGTVVVTGAWWRWTGLGASLEPTNGVDRVAAIEAERVGLTVVVVAGSGAAHGKLAGLKRNPVTVQIASRVVAFWHNESRGTADTIRLAQAAGKPVEMIRSASHGVGTEDVR